MKSLFTVWPLGERSNLNWLMGQPVPHSHLFHQVFFLTKGTGTHWVDGVETRLEAPWVMLIAKGKKHLFLPDVSVEGWMFDFGEDFLGDDMSWVFSDFLAAPNLPLSDGPLVHQATVLAKLLWDLGQVAREESRPAIRHLLAAFLHLLQARIHEQAVRAQVQNGADFRLFHAFLQLLDKNFQEEKEVEFYARKLRCTSRRLGAACKAVLGRTPQVIIIERVMLEAKRLLLHSDMSVQQIAALLGCEEQSNFTKAFRKATGETPSAFRRARQLSGTT